LSKYINTGGFPEVVVKGLDTKTYLETLFDAILLKYEEITSQTWIFFIIKQEMAKK
jgi:predicted AAA+ superfamily ATPase